MPNESSRVKVLGGRSELQIAALGGNSPHPAFDPANVQHLKSTIEEPINGWKTITHTFQAKDPSYIDDLLQPLVANNPPLVSVRFGLVAGDESNWRPWEDMVLLGYRPSMRADPKSGPLVTVKLCDRLWLLHTVKRAAAYRGAISNIVARLWAADAGGSAIMAEPTTLPGHTNETGIWYQAYESSWSFLMRCLLPLAANADGTSGYRVYVHDNELRFQCPGYKSAEPKVLPYTAGTPGFDSMEIEDLFPELAGGGGAAGFRRLVYDPVTGTSKLLESSASRLVKFAEQRPAWNNWEYRYSHVGRNLLAAEEARTQQVYAALSGEVYKCQFTSDKCMDIRVGDILDIELAAAMNNSAMHSGNWLISKAVHTLQEGGLSTKYMATRGEHNLPTSRAVLSPDSLGTDTATPGIKLGPQTTVVANAATGDGVTKPILSPN